MAYLSFIKSNGKKYVYITEYDEQKNLRSSYKNLYSLGPIDEAAYTLQAWLFNLVHLPQKLKEKGFNEEDICCWIETIKSEKNKSSSKTNAL